MSDLSAPLANASPANALLPGLRASTATAGQGAETPSFSSVLKDQAVKLAKTENGGAVKAQKPHEHGESSESAPAPAEKAPEKEATTTGETRQADASEGTKETRSDDDTQVADDTSAEPSPSSPIATLMIQFTPAALVASATSAANTQASDAGVPRGVAVRDLARGHGQDDKNAEGNHGLGLALGQTSKDDALTGSGNQSAGSQTTGENAGQAGTEPLALRADNKEASGLLTPQNRESSPLAAAISAEGERELPATGSANLTASRESDFGQMLAQVREGQASSANNPGRTHGTATDTTLQMRAPVGHPNWSNELGDKMTWMVSSQRQQADLVLNPPQLGRIEVSVTVNGDQANAVFASPNAAVREMLENSLPRLREIMAGAGLNLGQADVGAQSFAQQREQQAQASGHASRGTSALNVSGINELQGSVGGAAILRSGNGLGRVDTFV